MTVAKSSDVAIFDISAGWNLTGPNANHDRDPFTSIPRNMTATSNAIVNRYIGRDSPSYSRGGMTKRIMAAMPNAVTIHTNCLPLRLAKSKIEDGSEAWMDA